MATLKKPKFKSGAFEAIHAAASGMMRAGVVDKVTMREFDASCLAPVKAYKATQIKQLRPRNQVIQAESKWYAKIRCQESK